MKNKVLIVLALALTGFIFSCEKETVNPDTTELLATGGGQSGTIEGDDEALDRRLPCLRGTAIRPNQLPATIRRFLANRFPDLSVKHVIANRQRGYAVGLSNGLVLLFNTDGEFVKVCRRPRPDRDTTFMGGPRDSIFMGPRDSIRGPRGPRDTIRGPRDTIRGPRGPRGGGPR